MKEVGSADEKKGSISKGPKKMELKKKIREKWVKKSMEDEPEKKKNIPEKDSTVKKITQSNIVKTHTEKKIKIKSEQSPLENIRPSGKMEAPDTTATLRPLVNAEAQDWLGSNRDPDVMLSVPNLGIDHIGLKVKDLNVHVDLHAKVLDLVELHVGADASIKEVDLQIDNVRVQAMLKVKLDKVRDIIGDVVKLLDNHPEILSNLTAGLGKGLEGALSGKHGEVDKLSEEEKAAVRKMIKETDKKQE